MPSKTHPALTADFVKKILDYNPETGVFTWKPRTDGKWFWRWNTRYAGKAAGTIHYTGYIKIQIGKRMHYNAHVLAWLYMTGEWRPGEVDHRHGVRDDNRFAQLRLSDNSLNAFNKAMQSNNTSGFVGVTWNKQQNAWHARITLYGRSKHIGFFKSAEEAGAARTAYIESIDHACKNPGERKKYMHSRDRKKAE